MPSIYYTYFTLFLCFSIAGCFNSTPKALGTLEWDRINGRAVSSENITEVYVKEGDWVTKGQPLLKLNDDLQQALVKKLLATTEQARWQLRQLEGGYRKEEIASAKAELDARTTARKNRETSYLRQKNLRQQNLNSQSQLDNAKQRYEEALGAEEVAIQKLKEFKSGYQVEEIEQARAYLEAQQADLEYQQQLLERYTITATRDGKVDSIPYKLGDRPPINAVLTTLLAGNNPWARVYLPETWISQLTIGDAMQVTIDGLQTALKGEVRFISSVPSFTPYYALSEGDRSRLMYIAEINLLAEEAKALPVGVPVQVIPFN